MLVAAYMAEMVTVFAPIAEQPDKVNGIKIRMVILATLLFINGILLQVMLALLKDLPTLIPTLFTEKVGDTHTFVSVKCGDRGGETG